MTSTAAPLGLRERKNRRTQRAIQKATAELTLEVGYSRATLSRIAERADVSARTVSTWFPVKDDILFEDTDDLLGRITEHLRGDTGDVVDRLSVWIADELERHQPDPELSQLREAAIAHDPHLRARDRRFWDTIQSEVALAVAQEMGTTPRDIRAELFTGAVMALLQTLRAPGPPVADTYARIDTAVRCLRAIRIVVLTPSN